MKASTSVEAIERECDKLREERDQWAHRYQVVVAILDKMKAAEALRSSVAFDAAEQPGEGLGPHRVK